MSEVVISNEEWETLCRGCGSCCFEKIEDERGTIFYTQTPCRYLDVVSRQCRIYDNRFTINPECVKLTEELVPNLRWLPRGCGCLAPRREHQPDVPGRRHSRRKRAR